MKKNLLHRHSSKKDNKISKKEQKKRDKELEIENAKHQLQILEDRKSCLAKNCEEEFFARVKNKFSLKNEFTLSEKSMRYKDIIDFTVSECSSFDSFNKEEKSNDTEPDEIEKEFFNSFDELKKWYSIADNGIKGEEYTYKAIKMLDYKASIIRNIKCFLNDGIVENDIVVICENGIFTLEVKYISADKVNITQQGLLNGKNVIEQSRKHKHSIIKLLNESAFQDVPVFSMIVFSNDNCTFSCKNKNIIACYRNDVESIIFNEDKFPKCINKNDIDKIKSILLENSSNVPDVKYPSDIDEKEYFNSLFKYCFKNKYPILFGDINDEISKTQEKLDYLEMNGAERFLISAFEVAMVVPRIREITSEILSVDDEYTKNV